jgi:putative transposase
MKRSRFKEEQIIVILREQEAGSPTADVCRKHGVPSATNSELETGYGCIKWQSRKRLAYEATASELRSAARIRLSV